MNEKLTFDVALDQSLQMLAQGANLAQCLARFPQYADELAPLLEAALVARAGLTPALPKPNLARGKGRFLQAARRSEPWPVFRFAIATALAVVVVTLTGVGLTIASAPALPGDALYPIKLLAAQAELALTFDPTEREAMQHQQADDRRREIQLAAAQGRNAQVTFEGVVEEWRGDTLIVSGLSVRAGDVDAQVGDLIQVNATLRDGEIVAEQIDRLERAPLTPTAVSPTTTLEPTRQATPTPTLLPTHPTETRPSLTPTELRPTRTPTTLRPTSASATETRPTFTFTPLPTDSRPTEARPASEPTPTPRSRP